jgi:hypothetical protein
MSDQERAIRQNEIDIAQLKNQVANLESTLERALKLIARVEVKTDAVLTHVILSNFADASGIIEKQSHYEEEIISSLTQHSEKLYPWFDRPAAMAAALEYMKQLNSIYGDDDPHHPRNDANLSHPGTL